MTVSEVINAAIELDEAERFEVVRLLLSTLADVPPNAPYENVPDFAEMIETRLNDAHEGKKMVRFSMEEFRQRARHLNQ